MRRKARYEVSIGGVLTHVIATHVAGAMREAVKALSLARHPRSNSDGSWAGASVTWVGWLALLVMFGCCQEAGAKQPTLKQVCNWRAVGAGYVAYAATADSAPSPQPSPLPEPPREAEAPLAATFIALNTGELAESAGPNDNPGRIEQMVRSAIAANIAEQLAKPENQKSLKMQRAMNAAAEAFAKVMATPDPTPAPRRAEPDVKPTAPTPKVRCLFFTMGEHCPGCVLIERGLPSLDKAGWKIGSDDACDIQRVREGSALCRKYEVNTYPTLMLVNRDGDVVSRKEGLVLPPKELSGWINSFRKPE